jgi:RHS repeat-associated protein
MPACGYTSEAVTLPKTRVWGSKEKSLHHFSAMARVSAELRWGCEESCEKTALGSGVSFNYDPFGRRIEKISPTTTSIFAHDGDNLVETANASGGEVARYTQGQNIDEPLAMERGSTTDYYEADGLGSITSLTASNGNIAQSYTYDSFGNTTNSSGSLTNFFRYTAREFDTETNLYYYRARYYDPSSGRFVKEDPARFEAGFNFYAYVANSAPNFSDPLGQFPTSWHYNVTYQLASEVFGPKCLNKAKAVAFADAGGFPVGPIESVWFGLAVWRPPFPISRFPVTPTSSWTMRLGLAI